MILRNVRLITQRNNPEDFTLHSDVIFKKHERGTEALCWNLEDLHEIMSISVGRRKALALSEPVMY
jgi:hypothetical protein